ncbi:MAG: type II toxin-antitoxin system HicA family toxin [Oscillospiraceae bacterium]|nr:type II toxin-antitoxin system HicA family toxin [Oscillospiraceae bacterium]
MSGKELLKKAQQNGWVVDRINGSHHIVKKDGKTETIPVHGDKDIPTGLLNKILKRMDLK